MTFHRRPYFLVLLVIVIALFLVACGPATGSSGETNSAATPVDIAAGAQAAAAENNSPHFEVEEASLTVTETGLTAGFTADGHAFLGNPAAKVLMEEYSDFQCPYCQRFYQQTLPTLLEKQIANGEAVLVFYDFPLNSIHPQAYAASHAARCAGEFGAVAYWNMHDELFNNVNSWSGRSDAADLFAEYAAGIGLDQEGFAACMGSDRHREAIEADLDLGISRSVTSTPSFRFNGSLLAGAQPISVFDQAIATVSAGEPLAANEPAPAQPQQPAVAPTPVTLSDQFAAAMGSADAPITLVEYTDYQCPYCSRHVAETMPDIISNLVETGRVRYILKDFPLESLHPDARFAASAVRCAGEQDAYWEMHDEVFLRQQEWAGLGDQAAAVYTAMAEEIGLNTRDYNACLESGRYDAAVEENLQEGLQLGITGTPSFFINGFPVRGAQPYDLFEYATELAEEGTLADAYVPQEQQQQAQVPPTPAGPVDVPIDDVVFAIGAEDAPIVIVEYTDFQCPYCSRHHQQTLPQIMSQFVDSGLVRYVFKDFPLTSIHPQAVAAAEAGRCAAEQDAYLEMHNMLFDRQGEWSGQGNAAEIFAGYADTIGLETEQFAACMESHKYQDAVMADLEEGSRFGVRGTPAFFLNGSPLSGAQPYAVFEQAFNQILAAESQ